MKTATLVSRAPRTSAEAEFTVLAPTRGRRRAGAQMPRLTGGEMPRVTDGQMPRVTGGEMPPVTGGTPGSDSVEPGAELRTREAVVRLLLADGPLTAAALAERLGLSAAGIRRHLDQLDAEGAVHSREAHAAGPRGRGRPARAYQLTEIGRSRLPHTYDQLAVAALEFLADHAGPDAVAAFARQRAESIVAGVRSELAAASEVSQRADILARALTDHGFSASVRQIGIGEQLCQHHCPVAHVAARFPQLCEEEFAVIADALGTYAQRLATIARGDSFCTTFIPLNSTRPSATGSALSATPNTRRAPQGRITS